jgi:hypothetical protein
VGGVGGGVGVVVGGVVVVVEVCVCVCVCARTHSQELSTIPRTLVPHSSLHNPRQSAVNSSSLLRTEEAPRRQDGFATGCNGNVGARLERSHPAIDEMGAAA